MRKITKKKLNEIYLQPINPNKPFERLQMLMDYQLQKLNNLKQKL